MKAEDILKQAMEGDIKAFQELFAEFQDQLRSYLYRLTAHRSDAEDLTHDTFIRAYDKIKLFKGKSSLKTWVFQIGTHLAYNHLKKRNRWSEDVAEQSKKLVMSTPDLAQSIQHVASHSPYGKYEIKEHIDVCFTCMGKTLPVENQVALMLKDIYDFSVKEIMLILNKTEGTVKYLVQHARNTMTEIFDRRCALVNKKGICHQCSELNGWLNPKRDQQQALMEIKMVRESTKYNREELYALRTALVKNIDPLRSPGHEIQEKLMQCNLMASGEW
ncbi:MAG: RNA polymerase sigma factor [Bacteroidota bacterium]